MAQYVDAVERDGAHWLRPGEKVLAAAKVLGSSQLPVAAPATGGSVAVAGGAASIARHAIPGDTVDDSDGWPLRRGERGCVALTTSRLLVGSSRGLLERPRELRMAVDAGELVAAHVEDGFGGPWSRLEVRLRDGGEVAFDVSSSHDARLLARAILG